jgi:2-polyprenyl-3-methyl-5-hydroxy-6-metoxy-1,4-benzoquinol methylase
VTDATDGADRRAVWCQICGHAGVPDARDLGEVRGNTRRFKGQTFRLWKCPQCATIHSLDPVDFHDIYGDYPLQKRRLDVYARSTLANLTRRLERAGMRRQHAVLDYGCGNGLYLEYLRGRGYRRVRGYDPFVPEFAGLPAGSAPFDVVVNNDTIEHCDDVRAVIQHCADLLAPGGILYIGTADSEPVDMADLEPHAMRLHQPYHRVIITAATLARLADELGLEQVASYRRSYQDTLRPFANYRFLDELNRRLGHDLDRALDPAQSTPAFLRSPRLWFFALAGYFFPSAWEPAVVLRKL